MKKFLLFLICLSFCSSAFAETYHQYDNRGHKVATYRTNGNTTKVYSPTGREQYKYVDKGNRIVKYTPYGKAIQTIKK